MAPFIRIAIIGGGLAGASVIHALIKLPHLDVDIFEAAPVLKEAGMAIGIARNAQAALRLIGPSAEQCLDQAGAVPMRDVKFMLAQGEVGAGSMADEVDEAGQGKRFTSIMHRVELLQAVNELLCNQDEHEALYLWEHSNAATYVSGPVCITGDAAHSTTPWQGCGGGMSIEDSLILSTLLDHAKSPVGAIAALKVYDRVRRPRTQRIVESSRATGDMLIGVHELEPETSKSFMSRWDFIIDIDMEKHRDEALQMMETELKGNEIV